MQKNMQNRAVIFALTLVFALVICGAASAAPRGGCGPGAHFQKCCCNDGWNDGYWNWNSWDPWMNWNCGCNNFRFNRFHRFNRFNDFNRFNNRIGFR
ncbi:hypothetical protein [Methanobacterium paludis]|uniref:Uncharacterized protein n=1 Tax=Methanobacterium paludis (strain DSM 25820 / JCM 18151 / SWAN1) TaxID=868131 RepID=F6D353_METPW|nr:hypothetical protein [Methanobacterium paludis]AEG17993.1 hypothetical protein MSWAN_0969 [Methanobacterium paludis]